MWWKRFTAKYGIWERKEDLENIKVMVAEFEGILNAEVRQQEKLDMIEERDSKRRELPEEYIAKMLYRWDNGKFEKEYLKKLERNWQKWKLVSPEKKPWRKIMSELWTLDLTIFFIFFHFPFWELMFRVSMTLHVTVINMS